MILKSDWLQSRFHQCNDLKHNCHFTAIQCKSWLLEYHHRVDELYLLLKQTLFELSRPTLLWEGSCQYPNRHHNHDRPLVTAANDDRLFPPQNWNLTKQKHLKIAKWSTQQFCQCQIEIAAWSVQSVRYSKIITFFSRTIREKQRLTNEHFCSDSVLSTDSAYCTHVLKCWWSLCMGGSISFHGNHLRFLTHF